LYPTIRFSPSQFVRTFFQFAVLTSFGFIAACGGGGGGGGTPIDTTVPVITVKPIVTNVAKPELSGTVDDPAATISVTVDGNAYAATNQGDTWVLPEGAISPDLVNGTYDVVAKATNAVGNTGTDATKDEVQIIELLPDLYIKASNTEQTASVPDSEIGRDNFGSTVAVSRDGKTMAVGAPLEDGDGISQASNDLLNSGAVYVYEQTDGAWAQQAYLKAQSPGEFDQFGSALALSGDGNTLAVGAFGEDGVAKSSGTVYVFTRAVGGWELQESIQSGAGQVDGSFGISVALNLDGNYLAVGATGEETVYIFNRVAGAWLPQDNAVQASNSEVGDQFGIAVALSDSGDALIVGANFEDGNGSSEADNSAPGSGAVYTYSRSGATWTQDEYLKPSSPSAGSQFGSALSLNAAADLLVIGAPLEGATGAGQEGAAYIFGKSTAWSEQASLAASNRDPGDQFGGAVAITADGAAIFVGARLEDSRAVRLNGNQFNEYNDPLTGGTAFNDADSGAVYEFRKTSLWQQKNYYKGFNTGQGDKFGSAVAVDNDGSIVVIGASFEDGTGTGVDAVPSDESTLQAGAVYLFR
jgi:hypothetical protein